MCGSRGGDKGSGPLRESQVIWVSIEINIWTPSPTKKLDATESLEKYSFLCNKNIGPPLYNVK